MNESSPMPPPASPAAPPPIYGPRPLGDDPAEREPIPNVLVAIEALLRQPRRVMYQLRQPGAGRLVGGMVLVAVTCSLIYGVVMGSFSGHEQLWAAPVKAAAGLLLATLICLPSLYIFACLSGSRARLAEMFGMVVGMLMLMTILLIGFAPVAWLFSQSTESLPWMGLLHLVFWLVATSFGLRFLSTAFAGSSARSAAGLNTWIVIFLLVILQMSTALRPIIGRSETFLPAEKRFFVSHWFDCINQSDPILTR